MVTIVSVVVYTQYLDDMIIEVFIFPSAFATVSKNPNFIRNIFLP